VFWLKNKGSKMDSGGFLDFMEGLLAGEFDTFGNLTRSWETYV
jgi:hypothetical protein